MTISTRFFAPQWKIPIAGNDHCGTNPAMRVVLLVGFYMMLTLCALLPALLTAARLPLFIMDAQYYIQSGHVWSLGQVTYAASLIGMRVFTVLAYHLPQVLLGASIDSLSVMLGAVHLLFNLGVLFWLSAAPLSKKRALVLYAVLIAAASCWPIWGYPLTENLFVTLAVWVLAMLQRSRLCSNPVSAMWLIAAVGLLCGFGTGIRPEGLLLAAGVALAVALEHPRFPSWRQRVAAVVLLLLVFGVAGQTPRNAFRLWTGQDMPAQLNGFGLWFNTLRSLGTPDAGPTAQAVHREGQALLAQHPELASTDTFRPGMNRIFVEQGPRAASDRYAQAGLEVLRHRPADVAQLLLHNLTHYLVLGPGIWRMEAPTESQRLAELRAYLNDADRIRADYSVVRFGGDAVWPVSQILDRRIPALEVLGPLRTIPELAAVPPAWVLTGAMLAMVALLLRQKAMGSPAIAATTYFLLSITLAGFTQGYAPRYWQCAGG